MRWVLLVDEAVIKWLSIIRNEGGRPWLCLLGAREASKEVLYLCFVGLRVDVPDDDYTLQVWAIPSFVEGLYILVAEGL